MSKFVFVYYSRIKHDDMPMDEVKEAWMEWFKSQGDSVVDGGNPFNDDGHAVTKDGAEKIPAEMWPATGYSIFEAKNMEDAIEIAKGCPMLKHDPEAAVRVFEALPM